MKMEMRSIGKILLQCASMECPCTVTVTKKLYCDISLQQLKGIANSVHMGAFVIMGGIDSRADETVTDIVSGAPG